MPPDSSEETHAEAPFHRFAMSAHPDPVRSRTNEEVAHEEGGRPCEARQSLPAQKIWDGWSTLDPANVAKYYATGPHTFFDIAPMKYGSWDEYEKGVKVVLAGYKNARFTVTDDDAIHSNGNLVWATATVAEQMTTQAGKVEMGNFRWTVIFENVDGKWLIVHEHVSAPVQ